jgi:type II secretory pathway pseudopilin PulG
MRRIVCRKHGRMSQAGFSLVELLIASIVLTTGMLAIMGIFALAIGNNGRSKVDTTATMVAESVLEQIAAVNSGGGPSKVWDCNNKDTVLGTNEGGAPLGTDGGINFSASPPPPGVDGSVYAMNYVVCTNGTGAPATYDVRWNIAKTGYKSTVITVGARPMNMGAARFTFALPVTLRLTVGGNY